jgi:hypothetical protein
MALAVWLLAKGFAIPAQVTHPEPERDLVLT